MTTACSTCTTGTRVTASAVPASSALPSLVPMSPTSSTPVCLVLTHAAPASLVPAAPPGYSTRITGISLAPKPQTPTTSAQISVVPTPPTCSSPSSPASTPTSPATAPQNSHPSHPCLHPHHLHPETLPVPTARPPAQSRILNQTVLSPHPKIASSAPAWLTPTHGDAWGRGMCPLRPGRCCQRGIPSCHPLISPVLQPESITNGCGDKGPSFSPAYHPEGGDSGCTVLGDTLTQSGTEDR